MKKYQFTVFVLTVLLLAGCTTSPSPSKNIQTPTSPIIPSPDSSEVNPILNNDIEVGIDVPTYIEPITETNSKDTAQNPTPTPSKTPTTSSNSPTTNTSTAPTPSTTTPPPTTPPPSTTTQNTIPPQPTSVPTTTTTEPSVPVGNFYTSAASNASAYYPASCSGWKSLSTKNLRAFNTLEELLKTFPGRTLSTQCK